VGCSWPAMETNEGTDARFEVSEDGIPLEKWLDLCGEEMKKYTKRSM
jgi:hypothetical protein